MRPKHKLAADDLHPIFRRDATYFGSYESMGVWTDIWLLYRPHHHPHARFVVLQYGAGPHSYEFWRIMPMTELAHSFLLKKCMRYLRRPRQAMRLRLQFGIEIEEAE